MLSKLLSVYSANQGTTQKPITLPETHMLADTTMVMHTDDTISTFVLAANLYETQLVPSQIQRM